MKLHVRNKIIHSLPWITIFLSLMRRFVNDFHSWLRHSWKSLPNRLTRDKKSLFTVTHALFFISLVTSLTFLTVVAVDPITRTKKEVLVDRTPIWYSWSYSHENGPLRSSTSVASSHHAKMWGVNHAIFGIIRNAMSYSITRWNMTIFWRANFMLNHFKSKICFFINIYFHQTQFARANRYHWTLTPLKI